MFWKRKDGAAMPAVQDMTPQQVQSALHQGRVVLVDVREPAEHAAERIEGSMLHPLSRFDPAALPAGDGQVVLYCGVGRRSIAARAKCLAAGVNFTAHLEGGLAAWKAAGLPTVRG